MIGTFTGWQATLIIFFLAPFAALIISLTQWLLTGRRDIAFGPYLCLATCVLVVQWGKLWEVAQPAFSMGTFVPGVLAVGLALMGLMLMGLRWLRETFGGEDIEDESGGGQADGSSTDPDPDPPQEQAVGESSGDPEPHLWTVILDRRRELLALRG